MSFTTTPTPAQTDFKSPLNQTLFDIIRIALEQICIRVDAIFNGTTINANLVDQAAIAPAAVGRAELKTATEAISLVVNAGGPVNFVFVLATGFGFIPQWTVNAITPTAPWRINMGELFVSGLSPGPFTVVGAVQPGLINFTTMTMSMVYVLASPPYNLGDLENWGHFAYVGRDANGQVMNTWLSCEPPWARVYKDLPKNHPARWSLMPHPWMMYPVDGPDGQRRPDDVKLVDLRKLRDERISICPQDAAVLELQEKAADLKSLGVTTEALQVWENALTANRQIERTSVLDFLEQRASKDGRSLSDVLRHEVEPTCPHERRLWTALYGETVDLDTADASRMPDGPFSQLVNVVQPKE